MATKLRMALKAFITAANGNSVFDPADYQIDLDDCRQVADNLAKVASDFKDTCDEEDHDDTIESHESYRRVPLTQRAPDCLAAS